MIIETIFSVALLAPAQAERPAEPAAPVPAAEDSAPSDEGAETAPDDAAGTFGDTEKLRIIVMPPAVDESISKELAASLAGIMSQSLGDLGPFKAISAADIGNMLDYESQKQQLGCSDDVSCLSEIAGAFGADYVVSSSIAVADVYVMQLQLLDIKRGAVAARESRSADNKAGLIEIASTSVRALVRGILEGRAGSLLVEVSEEGATIEVDRRVVGVSPMEPLTLGSGVHNVSVEKRGFVVSSKDVEVREGETTRVIITLRPSEEFRQSYKEDADLMRLVAIGTAVAGGGALLAAGGLWIWGEAAAQDVKGRLVAYNDQDVRTQAELDAINADVRFIGGLDAAVVTAAIVGVAAIGTGVGLFFFGPDPGRYDDVVE